jgi:hypothetical protein
MAVIFAILLVAHGLIHLLGFVKAFGFADLPQLTQPVPPLLGVLWLLTAMMFLATAASLFVWPRGWWAAGLCAVVLSIFLVAGAWTDAKAGAIANVVVLVGVVFGFLAQGPVSLRAAYERDLRLNLAHDEPSELLTDADLSNLPAPVQRYLRTAGAVGQPRVRNFFVRMRGRIRNGPGARWISLSAEQHNFIAPAARLFYLTGSMFAIPVQGYHRYIGPAATMQIKAAALVPVVEASGDEMNQGETVTLFNDMCVMAPATLISRSIVWEPVDAHTTRAAFTNAGQTIRAELSFNDAGELTNFVSDDRYQADGKTIKKVRWSTPVSGYRAFGSFRLASAGEGHWHEPEGEYAYIQLTIEDVRYNLARR